MVTYASWMLRAITSSLLPRPMVSGCRNGPSFGFCRERPASGPLIRFSRKIGWSCPTASEFRPRSSFVDVTHASEIATKLEPLWLATGGEVELIPVMGREDGPKECRVSWRPSRLTLGTRDSRSTHPPGAGSGRPSNSEGIECLRAPCGTMQSTWPTEHYLFR